MALTPIDMKGMIPRAHEISDAENGKNVRERYIQAENKREQDKVTERELSQIKESEKSEGERIKRERNEEDLDRKNRRGKQGGEACAEDKGEATEIERLNVSVDSKKIKVGKKIDMKV